ncbi:hypothetical protein [Botrimarina mediterranea]|uniref:Uncharacterized protein n=1 Tax=Botrimarina mediterranea TaxID=2528022 RepID=A0A518K3V6_9BACT|nr:hypothetical protein [Botrimarina mediterranea]QDV72470.1 hypothetical protein Spa11_06480 [Botrimarina mediterranea]QDV77040.1 hypothetical protein K2D_06270 [Planctomycetes bacterium K2D]
MEQTLTLARLRPLPTPGQLIDDYLQTDRGSTPEGWATFWAGYLVRVYNHKVSQGCTYICDGEPLEAFCIDNLMAFKEALLYGWEIEENQPLTNMTNDAQNRGYMWSDIAYLLEEEIAPYLGGDF